MVDALARLVGGQYRHIQVVHLMELFLFSQCCALLPHDVTFGCRLHARLHGFPLARIMRKDNGPPNGSACKFPWRLGVDLAST